MFGLNYSDPNRSHAVVRDQILVAEHSKGVQIAKFASGVAGATAIGATIIKREAMSPALRKNIFFGTLLGLGISSSLVRGTDPGVAIATNTLTTAAGLAVYATTQKNVGRGIKALRESLIRNGQDSTVHSIENAIKSAKAKFPLLESILTEEAAAMGVTIAAVPVAHAIVQRFIAHHRRRTTDHGDFAFVPSTMQNNAGSFGQKSDNDPMVIQDTHGSAQVNWSGHLRTFYDHSAALGEL